MSILSDWADRWSSHAARMRHEDTSVATYVHVRHLEFIVSDLTAAVANLQAAVDAVPSRIDAAIATAVDAATAGSAQQIADLQTSLDTATAANGAAGDAVDGITAQVNSLAAPPAAPPA